MRERSKVSEWIPVLDVSVFRASDQSDVHAGSLNCPFEISRKGKEKKRGVQV